MSLMPHGGGIDLFAGLWPGDARQRKKGFHARGVEKIGIEVQVVEERGVWSWKDTGFVDDFVESARLLHGLI